MRLSSVLFATLVVAGMGSCLATASASAQTAYVRVSENGTNFGTSATYELDLPQKHVKVKIEGTPGAWVVVVARCNVTEFQGDPMYIDRYLVESMWPLAQVGLNATEVSNTLSPYAHGYVAGQTAGDVTVVGSGPARIPAWLLQESAGQVIASAGAVATVGTRLVGGAGSGDPINGQNAAMVLTNNQSSWTTNLWKTSAAVNTTEFFDVERLAREMIAKQINHAQGMAVTAYSGPVDEAYYASVYANELEIRLQAFVFNDPVGNNAGGLGSLPAGLPKITVSEPVIVRIRPPYNHDPVNSGKEDGMFIAVSMPAPPTPPNFPGRPYYFLGTHPLSVHIPLDVPVQAGMKVYFSGAPATPVTLQPTAASKVGLAALPPNALSGPFIVYDANNVLVAVRSPDSATHLPCLYGHFILFPTPPFSG